METTETIFAENYTIYNKKTDELFHFTNEREMIDLIMKLENKPKINPEYKRFIKFEKYLVYPQDAKKLILCVGIISKENMKKYYTVLDRETNQIYHFLYLKDFFEKLKISKYQYHYYHVNNPNKRKRWRYAIKNGNHNLEQMLEFEKIPGIYYQENIEFIENFHEKTKTYWEKIWNEKI